MNTLNVLKRAWQLVWHYRALWFLGALLALTAADAAYWILMPSDRDQNSEERGIRVILRRDATIYLPGNGVVVDFTAPTGVRVITDRRGAVSTYAQLLRALDAGIPIALWPIAVEAIAMLGAGIALTVVTRYVAEAGLIRVVDEVEETGRKPGLLQGLRAGWSRGAVRLFLLDLCTNALVVLALALMAVAVLIPLLLLVEERVSVAAGLVGSAGLAVLAGYLLLVASALASLVLQVARRACVLDNLGLVASIRQGVSLARTRFKDVGAIWLSWMGVRLMWIPLSIAALIVLSPVLLLSLAAGVVVGAVPAVVVGGIAGLFAGGVTPWIMGAMAGLPFFIVVTVAPLLFVAAPVEVFKSSIWTLAYRELRAASARALVAAASPTLARPAEA